MKNQQTRTFKKTNHKRDFNTEEAHFRRAVCKRCHCFIVDAEPHIESGEFWHPTKNKKGKPSSCINSGCCFDIYDMEIVPFLRKATRRRFKRAGYKA